MLKQNYLKEKLSSGRTVIGTWSVVPSAILIDIIASTSPDFVIIDSEHGPIGFETAQHMVISCESRGVSPVMRVGGIFEADILKALDIGVHCIQVPNVTSKPDVEELVRYVKYPPLGNRGFSPFTRAGNYSLSSAKDLTEIANESVLLAIHIEGSEAISKIDEILAIGQVDIIFVGLFDISKSLGMPGRVDDPKVVNTLEELTRRINSAGKYPGTIVTNMDQLRRSVDFGVRYITYSVDCEVISSAYRRIMADFAEHTKHIS